MRRGLLIRGRKTATSSSAAGQFWERSMTIDHTSWYKRSRLVPESAVRNLSLAPLTIRISTSVQDGKEKLPGSHAWTELDTG